MSVSSLKQLILHFISVNLEDIKIFVENSDIILPVCISEEIIETVHETLDGISDKDLLALSQMKLQFRKFSMNGKNINSLKSLNFLKNHPIQELQIIELCVAKSLSDIIEFINMEDLEMLSLSCIDDSFMMTDQTCSFLVRLKKLELTGSDIDNKQFQIFCDELVNLEELTIMEVRDSLYCHPKYLKDLYRGRHAFEYEHFDELTFFVNLRKLTKLKKLYLSFITVQESVFNDTERFIKDVEILEEISILSLNNFGGESLACLENL